MRGVCFEGERAFFFEGAGAEEGPAATLPRPVVDDELAVDVELREKETGEKTGLEHRMI